MGKLKPGKKRGDPIPRKPSVPIKFTPTVERQIIAFIKNGATLEDACGAAGITSRTLLIWRQDAKANPDGTFGLFIAKLDVALAQAKLKAIKGIHADLDWRAKAHWLSKRYPKEWGNQPTEIKVSTNERPLKDASEDELNAIEAQARAAESAYATQLAAYTAASAASTGTAESESGEGDSGEG